MGGDEEWGERDHLLIFAYQRYQDTTCPECGGYVLECRDEANRGVYTVASGTCFRKAEVDETTGRDGYKPEPGEVLRIEEIDADIVTRPAWSLPAASDEDQHEPDPGPSEGDQR